VIWDIVDGSFNIFSRYPIPSLHRSQTSPFFFGKILFLTSIRNFLSNSNITLSLAAQRFIFWHAPFGSPISSTANSISLGKYSAINSLQIGAIYAGRYWQTKLAAYVISATVPLSFKTLSMLVITDTQMSQISPFCFEGWLISSKTGPVCVISFLIGSTTFGVVSCTVVIRFIHSLWLVHSLVRVQMILGSITPTSWFIRNGVYSSIIASHWAR